MKIQTSAAVLAALGCLAAPASAWYLEVHNQIGHMADGMLNNNAHLLISSILEDKYQGKLGLAAGWADTVSRSTHKYSYVWHWISARDNPPDDCGLFYHRDCQEGGCVVQQINNQTQILEKCVEKLRDGKDGYKDTTCREALMWITHFIGDVAEPMHTSLRAFGGNTFKVMFNGTETNLHQMWDRFILYSQTGHPDGFSATEIDPYFVQLRQRIWEDRFREPRQEWNMCDMDARRGTYCPELWAKDSNAIVCDYGYGRYVNGTDLLDSGYASGAIHIVEQQLAKAAWRLSGWFNFLAYRLLGANGDLISEAGWAMIEAESKGEWSKMNGGFHTQNAPGRRLGNAAGEVVKNAPGQHPMFEEEL